MLHRRLLYFLPLVATVLGVEPQFDVPIVNVTVVAGQTAVLPCSIDHLAKHQVTWSRITDDDESLALTLTYKEGRIIDDYRYHVARPKIKEWNLLIRDIELDDNGAYLCTINTTPVRSKKVVLHVKVPPHFLDDQSSGDVVVQENETVSLLCKVTGVPKPVVTWHRVSALPNQARESKVCHNRTRGPGIGIGLTGEMLLLENVTRHCDDLYSCVADNGVKPRVAREMKVTVQFPPEIEMRNNHILQSIGKETILECKVTALPQAEISWEKGGKRIESQTGKYEIEIFDDQNNAVTLNLRVKQISNEDYGVYTCSASNALGHASGKMVLKHIADVVETEASTARLPLIIPWHSTKTSNDAETQKQPYVPDMPRKPVTRPPDEKPVAIEHTENSAANLRTTTTILWTVSCTVLIFHKLLLQT